MKHRVAALAIIIFVLVGFNAPVYAVTTEQDAAIQNLIENTQSITRAPGTSVVVLKDGETFFISSGYANPEAGKPVDEDTLWVLASVSKAFTALGILYLEEQGLLSLEDPIDKYLPWFYLKYRGRAFDMQELKLHHFMHHTSGLTNRGHLNPYNVGEGVENTLEAGVEWLNGKNLAFYPGERHDYGTVNYNILGLVIENVTGQSFEAFMTEKIFQPLGLTSTFANRDTAAAKGILAQSYQRSFPFTRNQIENHGSIGMAPTGFLISSSRDMARWMGIQLGTVEDIPDVFKKLIARSHEPGLSVINSDGTYYAAGWEVNADGTVVEHGGNNPGVSTYALLFPEEKIAVAVFSNIGTGGMRDVAYPIKDILDGNLGASFRPNIFLIVDIALTLAALIGIPLAILFFFLGLRRKKHSDKVPITKKKYKQTILSEAITSIVIIIVLPRIIFGFNATWYYLLSLTSDSFLIGAIALIILSCSYAWFKLSKTRIEPERKVAKT